MVFVHVPILLKVELMVNLFITIKIEKIDF